MMSGRKFRFHFLMLSAGLTLALMLVPEQALAASSSAYASGWTVNNDADWTPFPPNSNPLGAPDDFCTGTSTPAGSWAEFTFPAFSIPAYHTVTGIEVRFKYLSASGTNTARLGNNGSLVGNTRTVPSKSGSSSCNNTDWVSAGGASDLWGTSLVTADFNAGTVYVRLTQDANTIDLDSVEMIVTHLDLPLTSSQFASGWSVNNSADWTPFPPDTAPLGAANDTSTGTSTPTGSWAEFTFPAFSLPAGDTITGIEVKFKLRSTKTNTAQLKKSTSLVGSTRTVPKVTGSSTCSNTTFVTSGGTSDLWGTSFTVSDFNSGNVSVRLTQDANTIDLDAVELVVHH